MNIKLLAVVAQSPDIYHGWSTWKMIWENIFTPVNMTSFGRLGVEKHRDINNGEQYIVLDISFNIDCLYKR